jgi:hypothetical protein
MYFNVLIFCQQLPNLTKIDGETYAYFKPFGDNLWISKEKPHLIPLNTPPNIELSTANLNFI